jgi:hypothetical protein
MYVYASTVVWGVQSQYVSASDTSYTQLAPVAGNPSKTNNPPVLISCFNAPGNANYRAVGIQGAIDGNKYQDINSIQLICQDVTQPWSANSQFVTGAVAGTDSTIGQYKMLCPAGTYIVDVVHYGDVWLDRFRIICQ